MDNCQKEVFRISCAQTSNYSMLIMGRCNCKNASTWPHFLSSACLKCLFIYLFFLLPHLYHRCMVIMEYLSRLSFQCIKWYSYSTCLHSAQNSLLQIIPLNGFPSTRPIPGFTCKAILSETMMTHPGVLEAWAQSQFSYCNQRPNQAFDCNPKAWFVGMITEGTVLAHNYVRPCVV